jgi:hypothetical protein
LLFTQQPVQSHSQRSAIHSHVYISPVLG